MAGNITNNPPNAEVPSFWFQFHRVAPSNQFQQRYMDGIWAPPRPLNSNVRRDGLNSGHWYYFDGRTCRTRRAIPTTALLHFRTYSFYHNQGTFWIFPRDATEVQVGDGSGNPPLPHASPAQGNRTVHDDESTDGEDEENDAATEDWRPLTFNWLNNGYYTSFAAFAGERQRLRTHRPDQGWVYQLIPDSYLSLQPTATGQQHIGSLLGELPILIALIAFSVRPDRVGDALTHCLRRQYQPHNLGNRGRGWTDQRGLVIRVCFQSPQTFAETHSRERSRTAHDLLRLLQVFECGGYGHFFP